MGSPAKPECGTVPAAPQWAALLVRVVPTSMALLWQKYAEEQRWESCLCGPSHERGKYISVLLA